MIRCTSRWCSAASRLGQLLQCDREARQRGISRLGERRARLAGAARPRHPRRSGDLGREPALAGHVFIGDRELQQQLARFRRSPAAGRRRMRRRRLSICRSDSCTASARRATPGKRAPVAEAAMSPASSRRAPIFARNSSRRARRPLQQRAQPRGHGVGLAGEALQADAVHVQQRAIQVALVAQVVGAVLQRFAREDLSQHARSPG